MAIASYPVTTVVRLSVAITDTAGAAADPTGLTLKVMVPAGTVTTYTYGTDAALVKDSTGNYHLDYATTVEGQHTARYAGTGANAGATADFVFNIVESVFI